ncbi:MAG: cation transporter dimerization domain-containing protein, partial [Halobacteriota archaeon]
LIDREAAPELINRIRKTIESVPEVKKINYLHTRGSWSYKIVDVSITISRGLAVRELSTVQERIKAGVFSEVPEVYQVNIMASADEDLLTVAVSSSGSGLRAAFADDLGKCEYFVIARVQENHIDLIGTFVNQYKSIARKKGARVADFMHEHGVDVVITGHGLEKVPCSG